MQNIQKLSVYIKRAVLLFFLSFITSTGSAQTGVSPMENSLLFNPYIYLMLFVIFILIVVIMVLGKVLVIIAKNNIIKRGSNQKAIAILIIFALSFFPDITMAQNGSPLATNYYGIPAGVFFLLFTVIIIQVIIVFSLLNSINKLFRSNLPAVALATKREKSWLWKKLNDAVPIEEEETIMTDHVYDGIRELDNGMPPWLKYMFIATIAFAVIYLFNYHVLKSSPLQLEEYNKELADADIKMQEYRKNAANNIDETNATLLKDEASLNEGMKVFKTNCTACHGQLGEGGVGPNFTDDYWIHGGNIKDLFKVIKYGVVEKGMKSWQAEIAPAQIQQVASYIKSLHGTNPPNQKAKQGDIYIEKTEPDSTIIDKTNNARSDSLKLSVNK